MSSKANRKVFIILFLVYLGLVAFCCFGNFNDVPSVQKSYWGIPTDKIVHFIMFFPFPILCWLAFDRFTQKPWQSMVFVLITFLAGSVLAALTEIGQHFTRYRYGDPSDFRADSLALAISCLLVFIIDVCKQDRPSRKGLSGSGLTGGNGAAPVVIAALLLLPCASSRAQAPRDFRAACDSLSSRLKERTGVSSTLEVNRLKARGSYLDIDFGQNLSDYPWRPADIAWFKDEISKEMPESARNYAVGEISCKGVPIGKLSFSAPGNDGLPNDKTFRVSDPRNHQRPMVQAIGAQNFPRGLSGRYIALWQSHGRYFEAETDRWEWQRAPLFRTVEDMYTQSYVLNFLIPMLENSGAYVMTPRERDVQTNEIIIDNDPSFQGKRSPGMRTSGRYTESGSWEDAGRGFSDSKRVYSLKDNPFQTGTVRQTACTSDDESPSTVLWHADIPARGEYAVYISYASLPSSTDAALYTVRHAGGETSFSVNQMLGGGTWIYLGTFEFNDRADVILSSAPPEGHRSRKAGVVTADAVKIGGGMGKVARGLPDRPFSEHTTSGMPSFAEGALYSMQWAGVDTTITQRHDNDYTNDFADRGAWVRMMSGGSRVNPKEAGKKIPFDLSLAFHSDAGTTPNDSIIGTLAIYTRLEDNKENLPDGSSRLQGRQLADIVQTEVVKAIRNDYEGAWSRRFLWDRSYSESRTTGVPAMLLELLSHQNFADMKYGLDPSFQFTVSRAVYKGILKFLSNRYGCPYTVQPLPVQAFSVEFKGTPHNEGASLAQLSWQERPDPLEPTARPSGYLLYTRVDDGAFDQGRIINYSLTPEGKAQTHVRIEPGHIYSYKVAAFNEGGCSFPSETLSIGIPSSPAEDKYVLIVNNFDRVAAPAWFDTEEYAGFDEDLDSGVPYIREINFVGEQYQTRRDFPWLDDDCPGFGASYTDRAGQVYAGNTFDYPYIHGKALFDAGYAFYSCSRDAFCSDTSLQKSSFCADIICGKQVTTKIGSGNVPDRYQVFPDAFQKALRAYAGSGRHILVSGAHIGTDVWDRVYPTRADSSYSARTQAFVQEVLGYKWLTNYADRSGFVHSVKSAAVSFTTLPPVLGYIRGKNERIYSVEAVDGLMPAGDTGKVFLRYDGSNIPCGVAATLGDHRCISVGFPLEVLSDENELRELLSSSLKFFALPLKKK